MSVVQGASGLQISWVTRPNDLVPLYPEWEDLARSTEADVYLWPVWFAVWWKHFGAGRRLACLVARRDGRLVGVLPFVVETIWVGPLPLRVARLAGTDRNCIVFHLPAEVGQAPDLVCEAIRYLLDDGGCDVVSFTPVSERSDLLPMIRQIGATVSGLELIAKDAGSHVMFDLAGSFDDYLTSRVSRNRRSQFRSDHKALEKRFGMTATQHVPDAAAFAEFVTFHNTQWQAVGKGGHFTDWPGSAAFYADLADRSVPGWGVRIDDFTGRDAEGRSIRLAAHFSLVAGRMCHWRLPARSLDPEVHKLSIGKVALLALFRELTASGFRGIEGGWGEYDYKLSLGGENVPVHRIILGRASALGRLRMRLLLGWSELVHLAYYRIWFLKIAPRMRQMTGSKPRPLWRHWIRTRL